MASGKVVYTHNTQENTKGQKTSKKNMVTRKLQVHEYNKLNELQNVKVT